MGCGNRVISSDNVLITGAKRVPNFISRTNRGNGKQNWAGREEEFVNVKAA